MGENVRKQGVFLLQCGDLELVLSLHDLVLFLELELNDLLSTERELFACFVDLRLVLNFPRTRRIVQCAEGLFEVGLGR